MLRELKVRHGDDGRPRRWFADEEFDLVVWLDADQHPTGFQLSYDKGNDERALTVTPEGVVSHMRVDDGEDLPTRNRSPLLVADGAFDRHRVAGRFIAAAETVPEELRNFVLERLGHE